MRIIAGMARPAAARARGDATRPTADRTRETLFSMLTSRLGSFEGLTVADLFAGSGALGLEALSRGAEKAIFVEQAPPAIRAIRANIAALHAQPKCDVRAASVLTLGPVRNPSIWSCSIRLTAPARVRWRSTGWCGLAGSAKPRGSVWKPPPTNSRRSARARSMPNKVGKALLTLLRLKS
jgi:16S rRNA (guanine966-N2)-methyltransferase